MSLRCNLICNSLLCTPKSFNTLSNAKEISGATQYMNSSTDRLFHGRQYTYTMLPQSIISAPLAGFNKRIKYLPGGAKKALESRTVLNHWLM